MRQCGTSDLAQTDMKPNKITKVMALAEMPTTGKIEFKSVFKPEKEFTAPRVPGAEDIAIPAFAPGEEYEVKPDKSGVPGVPKFRLQPLLARELTSDANRRFAMNSVNRFWFLLTGRGLVHPLDMMHRDNPPSHPALLDLLASEFIAHKFDVRWLLREIALSGTYQRSTRAPSGTDLNSVKPESYRVANLKPLSAEQIGAATMVATGSWELLGDAAPVAEEETKTQETKKEKKKKDKAKSRTDDLIPLEPLHDKFTAFGASVRRIDGHDFEQLHTTFSAFPFEKDKLNVIICDTVRGKGLPSIEERADRWFCNFSEGEVEALLKELQGEMIADLESETLVVR